MRVLLLILSFAAGFVCRRCDQQYSCPDTSTCCLLTDGEWGCCPMLNAVCCDDRIHCCPDGSRCDSQGGRCIQNQHTIFPLKKKVRAQKKNEHNEIICPDRRSKCPSGTTCCLMRQGQYGCCPVEEAVCCMDQLHCCPKDFICDSTGQRCIRTNTLDTIRWLRKFPSTSIKKKPAISMNLAFEKMVLSDLRPVLCDSGHVCPAKTTCCSVEKSGNIHPMCCPLSNAVCCKESCCPSGYHCRLDGKCEKHARRNLFIDF